MAELVLSNDLKVIVADFTAKINNITNNIEAFLQAQEDFLFSTRVNGAFASRCVIREENPYESDVKQSLLESAWREVYKHLQIERIATAKDKGRIEQLFCDPIEFNAENLKSVFGEYIQNPRQSILRGVAEVFGNLDPAYKSHSKVKIGVKGLPKRVIIKGVVSWWGRGDNQVRDILNALAQYQGMPLLEYAELDRLCNGDHDLTKSWTKELLDEEKEFPARGVWGKGYQNGNLHLFFDKKALCDINMALAEFYGDVLPDAYTKQEKAESTDLAKDLQYYPTPKKTVKSVLSDVCVKNKNVLEPQCGCGRFMDGIKRAGGDVFGIECHQGRVEECRAKGHKVMQANFLEVAPKAEYDVVIMNPPFFGKHYFKHLKHAAKFLKEDGQIVCILPITARYDHGLLGGSSWNWSDLPVGSFSESGTNINTTVFKCWKKDFEKCLIKGEK